MTLFGGTLFLLALFSVAIVVGFLMENKKFEQKLTTTAVTISSTAEITDSTTDLSSTPSSTTPGTNYD